MSTDRELLEAAAKAAGYDVICETDPGGQASFFFNDGSAWTAAKWNPLADDGDALRLAVKLKLMVMPQHGEVVIVDSYTDIEPAVEMGADTYAATRRAIVRAAAALAKGAG